MRVQLTCWQSVKKTLLRSCLIQKSLSLFFHLYSINGFSSWTRCSGIWSAVLSKGHIVNSWTLIFSLISHRAVMMQGSLLKAPVLSSNNGLRFHPGYTPWGTPSLQAFHSGVSSCRRCRWMFTAAFWTPVNMCCLTARISACKNGWMAKQCCLLKLLSVFMIIKQQETHKLCVNDWFLSYSRLHSSK